MSFLKKLLKTAAFPGLAWKQGLEEVRTKKSREPVLKKAARSRREHIEAARHVYGPK